VAIFVTVFSRAQADVNGSTVENVRIVLFHFVLTSS
jgi:hypothetical protein